MYTLGSSLALLSYFFLEFATSEQASGAVKAGNGYKLDKSHIFAVNFFADFDKWACAVIASVHVAALC